MVVSVSGSLIGYGAGEPPGWVVDAAGAELWAYYTVLSLCVDVPEVVTDCKGILDGLSTQPATTTGPKRSLARTWSFIRHALDDDFSTARARLCWMPSHKSASNLSGLKDARGQAVTTLMWRANRLADALAKDIAARHRLPRWALSIVRNAGALLKHQAARLGTATHLANNHEVLVTLANGSTVKKFVRDSTAQRPHFSKKSRAVHTPGSSRSATTCSSVGTRFAAPTFDPVQGRGRKRASSLAVHRLRQLALEEDALANCLISKQLRPSTGPSADDRLARFKERVRLKERMACS